MKKILSLITAVTLSFSFCAHKSRTKLFQNSLRSDVDIFLIPKKFNIMESEWVETRDDSSFLKSDLIRHLKNYGRNLEMLKNDPSVKYREKDDIITMNVAKTSHSTFYEYDTNIPVIFYGPRWIQKGIYQDLIHQQNIVPTLAKITGVRNPNGVEVPALSHILKIQSPREKPEIIVTVVIDQGGQQVYKAHPGVPKNIEKIKESSAYFPNAHVGHLDAHTAVGHMAIGTGSYPSKSTVVGNTFFHMRDGVVHSNEIYALNETEVNPDELHTESFADVLDSENGNGPEVISQCYALRASIGMAGHGAFRLKNSSVNPDKDFVYWLDKKDGKWTTDTRYYQLPGAAKDFLPYETHLKNYPEGWKGHTGTRIEDLKKHWSTVMAAPAEARLEGELFRKVIQQVIVDRGKNKDNETDLAYITLKAGDAVGHGFGWESIEAKETFSEIDSQIGQIKDFLDQNFGDKYILMITADHGCAPLPEISGGQRLTVNKVFSALNSLLPPEEKESLAGFMTVGQISMNKELVKKYGITESQIRKKILGIKGNKGTGFFEDVVFRSEIPVQ